MIRRWRLWAAEYKVDKRIGDAMRHARFCPDCSLIAVCSVFENVAAALEDAYDNLARVNR